MALLPKNLDYSDKDFDSIRLRLQALVRSVFPTWTDFNVANFGNILLELYAFLGDTLTYYQDNQALESRIATATQRKNLIALCKLIGFVPDGARAATVDVTFTLKTPPTGSVTLPAGTVVSTADVTSPVSFQLLSAVVFPPAMNPPSITATVENSASESNVFTSNGLPNQSFVLGATPYLDESAIPTASDGVYTEVENFLDSTGTDRHFIVVVDQNDRATLTFGNGTLGKIPVGTISVAYKTGGGAEGKVEALAVRQIQGTFTDNLGNPVQVSVTNASAATGGVDRQTNAQIQLLAPSSLRAGDRTVSREDFEIHARTISTVARALMTTSNEDAGVQENSGILYIVPVGGGPPTQALKDEVRALFISSPGNPAPYPSTLTFSLAVQDPLYLTVDVYMVAFFRPGVAPAVGAKAVRDALKSFFAIQLDDGSPNPNVDFGYYYRDANDQPLALGINDVLEVLEEVPEVLRVGGRPSDFLLNGIHGDVPILVRQFPKLGSVTIVNGVDGSLV